MADPVKLGRYELRRVLGKGAMGVVYEGFDPALGRRVAVKTILKSVALDDETERSYGERFEREAKAVARLNHPNIVQVHDFGVENEVAYLVMEFIQGSELRKFFEANERFESAEAVRIMGELLDALEFAHKAGVIHRDVKPANVMLDTKRRVKLADFGVARVQDSDRSAAGTMVGTPAFMSPEQISGGKVDRRTDIFSAGTIFYQLLTGEQPFKGQGAWTVAKQIMQDDPPAPSSVVRSVSPAFDEIVDKALAKNPGQRYANAREFAAAVRAALPGGPEAVAGVQERKPRSESRGGDAEVEFWRSIQNSQDPAEFEVYLHEFPEGTYAKLARLKIARLRAPVDAPPAKVEKAAEPTIVASRREPEPAPLPPSNRKSTRLMPVAVAAGVLVAAVGAYLKFGHEPVPVAQTPVPPKVGTPASESPKPDVAAVDAEKARKASEERIQRETAERLAVERAAAAKSLEGAAAEKAAAEKSAAEKAAGEKTAQARLLAARAAAEKIAAEKAASERAAAEQAALAERLAADKAAADKLAKERAASEKLAADKLAAEKAALDRKTEAAKAAAAARTGWPGVGDRWVYGAVDVNRPDKKSKIAIEVQAVTPSTIREVVRPDGGVALTLTHQSGPILTGIAPGIASFAPYLRAFQEIRAGQSWRELDYKLLWQCSSDVSLLCNASGRIAGRERVTVAAGEFDAWKIVIDLLISGRGTTGGGEFIYWYSEEARRVVKYRSRVRYDAIVPWTQPDIDMELQSYSHAGPK